MDNIFTRNPNRIEAYIKSNVHIDQGESPSQASDHRKQLLGRLSLTASRRAFNGTGERRVIRTQKWVGTIRYSGDDKKWPNVKLIEQLAQNEIEFIRYALVHVLD